jgi:hypothetical protein
MLSTIHSAKITESRRIDYRTGLPKKKTTCVTDYNYNMGAVDKVDMTLSSLHCIRKSIRWHKKYLFHLLDLSMYNAHIIHKQVTGKKKCLANFIFCV